MKLTVGRLVGLLVLAGVLSACEYSAREFRGDGVLTEWPQGSPRLRLYYLEAAPLQHGQSVSQSYEFVGLPPTRIRFTISGGGPTTQWGRARVVGTMIDETDGATVASLDAMVNDRSVTIGGGRFLGWSTTACDPERRYRLTLLCTDLPRDVEIRPLLVFQYLDGF